MPKWLVQSHKPQLGKLRCHRQLTKLNLMSEREPVLDLNEIRVTSEDEWLVSCSPNEFWLNLHSQLNNEHCVVLPLQEFMDAIQKSATQRGNGWNENWYWECKEMKWINLQTKYLFANFRTNVLHFGWEKQILI